MGPSEILVILVIGVLMIVIPTVILSVMGLVLRSRRQKREMAVDQARRVPCPYCRERIHPEATVCPYCRRDQPQVIDV